MLVVGDAQPVVRVAKLGAIVGGLEGALGWLDGVFAKISNLVALGAHDLLDALLYSVWDQRRHTALCTWVWVWVWLGMCLSRVVRFREYPKCREPVFC